MTKKTINREYKDRLFKYIFGNEKHKEFTLSLYNAINKTDYSSTDDIEITTIENAVYMGMHNDVSFIIADSMNLYEQQSTFNPNMPLRMLIYAGQLYDKFLNSRKLSNDIYDDKLVAVPYPKLIVFYNGERFQPNKTKFRLSDSFADGVKGDIEVSVTMLNVNYGKNRNLLERSRPLSDYSLFTTSVRELKRKIKNIDIEEAVEESLRLLPEDSEVRKLIEANKAAVAKMVLFEYNEKAVMESMKKNAEEKGRQEGEKYKALEVAKSMLADGFSLETISKYSSIPIEELEKLK